MVPPLVWGLTSLPQLISSLSWMQAHSRTIRKASRWVGPLSLLIRFLPCLLSCFQVLMPLDPTTGEVSLGTTLPARPVLGRLQSLSVPSTLLPGSKRQGRALG